jgi:hypothetical protein
MCADANGFWMGSMENDKEWMTLIQAAKLAGVSTAELRRYANELLPDGSQRLKTRRVGSGNRAVHYTTTEWLRECMANRKKVRGNRPPSPILEDTPETSTSSPEPE